MHRNKLIAVAFFCVLTGVSLAFRSEEVDPGLPLGPYDRRDATSGELSIEQAAEFLDTVAANWGNKHGCVTCHTNGYYLTAPASIFEKRPAFQEVRQFAGKFVGTWDEQPPETEVMVATAAFLAINDAQTRGSLSPETVRALDHAWDHQDDEGHWVDWVKCNWPPFESDDHFGVTLVAIAVGMAPADYQETERARAGMVKIRSYVESHPPTHLHHKAMLLWAASYHGDLLEQADRRRFIEELVSMQREDGGWASGDLGRWRQLGGEPTNPPVHVESDGYGTGFVVFVLRQAGVQASDPRLQRGIDWLRTHQRAGGYWWTQSLRNEPDTSNFLTHAGTTFALKALEASGAAIP